jgi:uncharacterized integral membrane protein
MRILNAELNSTKYIQKNKVCIKYMSNNYFINIILIIFFLLFLVFSISNKLKRMNKIENYLKI